ncbi:MAG TPA: hypothetical protein VNG13_13570 [Mycobacteriales bacterium]|nr:hypothetical protein [Mycobacteriales bacterium]
MTDVLVSPALSNLADYGGKPLAQASGRSRLAFLLDPASHLLTYAGVLAVMIGFTLIGVAWSEVAGTLNVGLQIPYLVSGGFTGLGLVMVGLVTINVAAKRQDSAERTRQLERLTGILDELKAELDDTSAGR